MLIAAMMLNIGILPAHASTLLFDTGFEAQTVGAAPSGWTLSRTTLGSFTVTEQADEHYLAVEDYGGDSGPYGLYAFAPMTGANTIHAKFQAVHQSAIEFMPAGVTGYNTGIRLNLSSANTLSVESAKNNVYADPLPGYRLQSGTWLELWLTFDTDADTATLFLRSPAFLGYAGAMGAHSRIVDDYLIIEDIPLTIANIGTIGYGTYKGAGTTLIAFMKGMTGLVAPIVIPVEAGTVLFDADFAAQTTGSAPSGWSLYRTDRGSFSIQPLDGVNRLRVEDYGGNDGPYGIYPFTPLTGKETLYAKLQLGHDGGIEFMAAGATTYTTGVRLSVSSAGILTVESEAGDIYEMPLGSYQMPAGTWAELWLCFDTDEGTAELFIKSTALETYSGALGAHTYRYGDTIAIRDIPLTVSNFGTVGYGAYTGGGTYWLAALQGLAGRVGAFDLPGDPFDTAFGLQSDGASPEGWEIQGSHLGSFTIDHPGAGSTAYLKVEDYGGDSGPYGIYRFDPMAGEATIYAKLQIVQHATLELMPAGAPQFSGGLRMVVSSSNTVRFETATNVLYSEPLPGYRFPAGTWVELWVHYNTNTDQADVFLRSDALGSYRGAVDSLARLHGSYVVVPDIPLTVPNLGTVGYGTYKGAGITRIEQISGEPGDAAPIEVPLESDRPEPPEKPDVSAYLTDTSTMMTLLNSYVDTHSRLFVQENEWSALSARIATPQFEELYAQAEQIVQTAMAAPLYVEAGDTAPDENQRHIGDNLAAFSFMYKVTGDTDYLDAAVEWAELALSLSKFGAANNDLAAGHILFGMGVMYDWLYDDLDGALKAAMYDKLFERAAYLNYVYENNQKTWTWEYLQNHGWINLLGMVTAGLAIYGEDSADDAEIVGWFENAQQFFAHTFTLYGPDGASQEGVGYWSYGVSVLLRYGELAETFFGIDVFASDWLENTGTYRLYAAYPKGGWELRRTSVNLGDALGYDFGGPTNSLYQLAARYERPELIGLADAMLAEGLTWDTVNTVWENLLYYDPAAPSEAPEPLPTLHHFEDFGLVFARSGWDDDASALYFRSGPFLGKHATTYTQAYPTRPDFGSGHMHPDANAFVLFGNNEVLLRDDGYAFKKTGNHNTLLVDGVGQMGENGAWFNSNRDIELSYAFPEMTKVESSASYDYFVGASAEAYPDSVGLSKFDRHMLYLKEEDILLVVDDIEAEQSSNLELRWFPETQNLTSLGDAVLARSARSNLLIDNLTPGASSLDVETLTVVTNIGGSTGQRKAAVTRKTGESLLTATALSWSAAGEAPAKVNAVQSGRTFAFTTDDVTYTLDLDTMQVTSAPGSVSSAPGLSGVLINGAPLAGLTAGLYSYTFDLDDYPRNLRKPDTVDVLAIPAGPDMTVDMELPTSFPGEATITVSRGTQQAVYTIEVAAEVYDVARLPLSVVHDVNPGNPDNLPSAALDEVESTYWTQNGDGVYVDFDLGQARAVSGFDMGLFRGAERVSYFHLEASADGVNFTEIYRGESSGLTGEPEYYALPQSVTARYLRLVGHGNSAGHYWFSVSEFGAYGEETP
ncbi:hypothetical protein PA598K_05852 [Paenibacillus sp. 598K]|nr:hypothetical protein PA598K_05852 [Paenibacillus sp. 598K]